MMDYQIIISERATEKIRSIFDYLERNWSEKVKIDFKEKLLTQVELLRKNPFLFPASEVKKGVRKCLITKHNVMYYRVMNNEVQIITIHDTRTHPKSLKL